MTPQQSPLRVPVTLNSPDPRRIAISLSSLPWATVPLSSNESAVWLPAYSIVIGVLRSQVRLPLRALPLGSALSSEQSSGGDWICASGELLNAAASEMQTSPRRS